jgi:hypothetical protein
MGNTLPKLHQVFGITYNNGQNDTHGEIITSTIHGGQREKLWREFFLDPWQE